MGRDTALLALIWCALVVIVVAEVEAVVPVPSEMHCPVGIAPCDTALLRPLFGSDFFAPSGAFERRPWLETTQRSAVLNLVENFKLEDWAQMLETSLSRVMITELRKYSVEPSDGNLDSARGMLAIPKDVEFLFPEGRGTHARRQAVTDDMVKRIKRGFHVLSAANWMRLADQHGFTIVFRDVDGRHEALNKLAASLRSALGLEVGISMYYTPGGRAGVEPHIDDMDVVLVPLLGKKKWTLRASTVPLPVDRVETFHPLKHIARRDADGFFEPMELVVERGDALYIPRGVIHNATDMSTGIAPGSLHISIGIEPLPAKTVRAAVQRFVNRVHEPRLVTARVNGVAPECFNGQSIVKLVLGRDSDTGSDVAWRKAILRPSSVLNSSCYADANDAMRWASDLRAAMAPLVNASARRAANDAERGRKVFELLRSLVGETSLNNAFDVWFDNVACNARGTDIIRKIGDAVDKDPKKMLATIAADMKLFNDALPKDTQWWCLNAWDWFEGETRAEAGARADEDKYLKANMRLWARHALLEPLPFNVAKSPDVVPNADL